MPQIDWRHNRQRLVLQVVVVAPLHAPNPNLSVRTTGLIDTGATGTGIRPDIADDLGLRAKGQRRIETANGPIIAPEFLGRIGFVCGDYEDAGFIPDQQQPYLIDEESMMFGLQGGFRYPMLIGMDVVGTGDLTIRRDGTAQFVLY